MSILTPFKLSSIALSAALCALPAIAQDSTDAETSTDTGTAAAEAPVADAPETEAMAADQDASAESGTGQDALGQPYVSHVEADWQIECLRTTLEADPCRMVQMLLDQGNPAVRVEIVALPEGGPVPAVATFYTPLETLLSEQLSLSVDGGRQSKHMFNYCSPQFCVSQIPFAPDAVAAFKRGNVAEAVIVPLRAPDQTVQLTMSLKGFTAGFDKLTELTRESDAAMRKAAQDNAQGGN